MDMSKEDLLKLLWLQQKKIELLEKEKGREDGLDYTAKIAYDPNTVESTESVEIVGEVNEPNSKS
ncbi:MAG: hypothetical protein CMN34_05785 [Saprospirales bacterium]|nr:hypothetical protein [Saprospirales bacterium]